jgi:signal transduction histidine kinase
MTLVNRVSAFFLGALAVLLLGYSTLLFLLVRQQLMAQFDQQLDASLHTLVAAVEVEFDDVKWEPSDHTISLGNLEGLDEVRWFVRDDAGRVVDHSRNFTQSEVADAGLLTWAADRSEAQPAGQQAETVGDWRVLSYRLAAPTPKPVAERDPFEYAALRVVVARSPAGLNRSLTQLGLLAGLLPIAAWSLAALAGRWYCRQALAPVGQMAELARASAGSFRVRFPVGSTPDELSDLSNAFNGLLEQLQAVFERQRRFTGDAAHQLRTPLTVLRGQVDVALRRPRSADEYTQTLAVVQQQTLELQQLVDELLFLARSAVPAGEPTRVDLADWLPAYLERWKDCPRAADIALAPANGLTPDRAATVRTVPTLLAQLLDNLLNNAIKYSPAGTPIHLSAVRSSAGVTVTVADRGLGIAPEDQASLFTPFFRTAQARQSGAPGTGLGLAIAAHLATALGGDLRVESQLGSGSRFMATFPAVDEP